MAEDEQDQGDGNGGAGMGLDDVSSSDDRAPDLAKKADQEQRAASDLEPVYDVPVRVQAVLGKSKLEISQLLKLAPGAVVELDRKVGEAIDIYVNNRLVARGEVVLVEEHLGVTMTEIIKLDDN
ncbi:flagellar motor switch protein FliN [Yunchengibacter salinarum]|uniref:flagellar motor switch protein FliN n=1 Tax=Yunchengibacter salinarum TaxID=3133399 RepID=UPI0035B65401